MQRMRCISLAFRFVFVAALFALIGCSNKTNNQLFKGCKRVGPDSFLITNGFPYRTDIEMNYKDIRIENIEHGIFTTAKDSVQPVSMGGMVLITQGPTYFMPIFIGDNPQKAIKEAVHDVLGNKWTFVKPGISFTLQGCVFKTKSDDATIEFRKDGVFVSGFEVIKEPVKGKK